MKSANQINRVSQSPSHDTGKLAHGDKFASSVNESFIVARCHQDFWEVEESSTGEAALSRLGIGTGMWPLSSVGNWRGQKIFQQLQIYWEELEFFTFLDRLWWLSSVITTVIQVSCKWVIGRGQWDEDYVQQTEGHRKLFFHSSLGI